MTTETNAERLERISKTDRYMYDRSGKHVTVSSEDFDWLIQRSERAQEMEKTNNEYFHSSKYLLEENARLRKSISKAIGCFNYDEHQEGMATLQYALQEDSK